jgi:hypothetical protein
MMKRFYRRIPSHHLLLLLAPTIVCASPDALFFAAIGGNGIAAEASSADQSQEFPFVEID